MIHIILRIYLLLFPRCEMMVSFLTDFSHCNDSSAWATHCYAKSDWDYGGAMPAEPLTRRYDPEAFIIQLPFVRSVSCWR